MGPLVHCQVICIAIEAPAGRQPPRGAELATLVGALEAGCERNGLQGGEGGNFGQAGRWDDKGQVASL